jgi:hypothetical protein
LFDSILEPVVLRATWDRDRDRVGNGGESMSPDLGLWNERMIIMPFKSETVLTTWGLCVMITNSVYVLEDPCAQKNPWKIERKTHWRTFC